MHFVHQAREKHQILSASAEVISIVQTKINSVQLANTKFVKIVNYVRHINTPFYAKTVLFRGEFIRFRFGEYHNKLILNLYRFSITQRKIPLWIMYRALRVVGTFLPTYLYCHDLFFCTPMLQQQRYEPIIQIPIEGRYGGILECIFCRRPSQYKKNSSSERFSSYLRSRRRQ